MECKKLANDLKEVENGRESVEEEDERKLPTWMIKSEPDETNQNDEEEAPNSPTASSSARANVEDSKPEIAASTSTNDAVVNKRVACKYGENCYRSNPVHKEEYSHPGDEDYTVYQEDEESTLPDLADYDEKPECQYGTSCYRQNPQHKRDFKHTQPPHVDTPEKKNSRKPAKRRRTSDADYESEGDKEYDLEDSFIDDDEDDIGEEEEDEDYVPDKSELLDPELLKEDQWKATADDAPEVLELLKEARDYLRNKKLHQ